MFRIHSGSVYIGRIVDFHLKVNVSMGRIEDFHLKMNVSMGRIVDFHLKMSVSMGRMKDFHVKMNVFHGTDTLFSEPSFLFWPADTGGCIKASKIRFLLKETGSWRH